MAYKGRYIPKNPQKYKGDYTNIVYRSLWERKFMVYCDETSSVLEWGSEEVIIPYLSPWDGRIHRYFPDFYTKVKQHDGTTKKMIIEVIMYVLVMMVLLVLMAVGMIAIFSYHHRIGDINEED